MQNVFNAYKQIEQTLRYLTTIAEQTNEGIVVVDLDSSLRFVNEAWAWMHGYKTKDELIGRQISIFHTEEQIKSDVIPLFEKVKQNGRIEGIVEHIKSDGTVFPTKTKMVLTEDEAGKTNGLIIFAANIRQHTIVQKATAENLKQVEHLSERITQFQVLLGECLEAGECLAKQTGELQANNETLLQQMNEFDQSPQRPAEQHSEQIVHFKAQETTSNQRPEDKNPECGRTEEASAENSEPIERSKNSVKLPNAKELGQAAKLASRLSESPDQNFQSEHKDNQKEPESHINRAISEEWMHTVQKHVQ
ncbi:MAG: PAS domain-containing protein [Planctomycetota bacterium]|jgi:PAS domain S-box-containing protein